jgi:methanogenic corrinoid protein MtbC1
VTRTPRAAPLYRIQAVANATGVSEHALRVWERRYGELASKRSAAGYRLYTEEDVGRIKVIKELLDQGHAIGEIATLPVRDLERMRDRGKPPASPALPQPIAEVARKRFLDAIAAMDPEEAQRVAASATVAFPAFELISSVIAPILRELGERWTAGEFTIAQEHAASAIIRNQLGELLRMSRPSEGAPTIVVTTPEGELHEFGAMLAGVAATTVGARVVYLGPNTPAEDLAAGARGSRAKAVVLSVVALDPKAAYEAIASIRKALPKNVAVWVGGAQSGKPLPPGVIWTPTLDDIRARTMEL